MSLMKFSLATDHSTVARGTFVSNSAVRSGGGNCLWNISHSKSEASWVRERLEHGKPLEGQDCPFSPHTHLEFSVLQPMLR